MLAKRFSLYLDNQDQHPIQDQPPLPSNEQPVQQDKQLPQDSPMSEGQTGSEQQSSQSDEEFDAGSLNSEQGQSEFWDNVHSIGDYFRLISTHPLNALNSGPDSEDSVSEEID